LLSIISALFSIVNQIDQRNECAIQAHFYSCTLPLYSCTIPAAAGVVAWRFIKMKRKNSQQSTVRVVKFYGR